MKTEDLIVQLSAGLKPVRRGAVQGRLAAVLVAGALLAGAILVAWLGLRPLGPALAAASFWMKAGYTATLALAGWVMVARLARPQGDAGAGPVLALAAFVAVALVGIVQLQAAPPQDYARLLLGNTWSACPFRIVALSAPVLAGLTLVLRRMAPTRLALAGAAAGLLAGGVGASVYGLYCQETSAAFVAVWYSLGVAAMAALGALAGPRLLRW
jgi:hypothetical protein